MGKSKVRQSKGKDVTIVLKPKYYGSLREALRSLPEREAADCWDACDDMDAFRGKMKDATDEILRDVEMADMTKDKV